VVSSSSSAAAAVAVAGGERPPPVLLPLARHRGVAHERSAQYTRGRSRRRPVAALAT
jgi:hypothetical protein